MTLFIPMSYVFTNQLSYLTRKPDTPVGVLIGFPLNSSGREQVEKLHKETNYIIMLSHTNVEMTHFKALCLF